MERGRGERVDWGEGRGERGIGRGEGGSAGGGVADKRRKIAPLIHPAGNEFNKNVDKES
jgi:hypothetical protein